MSQMVDFGGILVDISQINFNDTSSRVTTIQATSIALIILVVSVVSLRLFVRTRFVGKVFADDVLIVLAAIFTLALASTCIAASHQGIGTHIWQFPLATISESIKSCILYLFVCQILYACAIALTKLAIVLSYLRLIQATTFRLVMWLTLFTTAGLWVCGVFVSVFQCLPISGAWDYTAQQSCIDYISYLYASSSVNVLTDICLCAIPIPHLWGLNMPLKQRVILCVLFAGGAGACVAGIARIAYLHNLRVLDVPFQSVPSLNLSVIECSLGIICVSIPALRPLVAGVFPSGSRTDRTSSTKTGSSKPRSIPLSGVAAHSEPTNFRSDHESDTQPFAHPSPIGYAL